MNQSAAAFIRTFDEIAAEVTGVFNEAAVFDYLWKDSETIIGRQTLVAGILP